MKFHFSLMKRLSILLTSCFLLCSAGSAEAANFRNMSFMGTYQALHPITKTVFEPFIANMEAHFKGKVSFNYFGSNVLYPVSEEYGALQDGRVDFGTLRGALIPGVINLSTVVNIPGMASNSIVGSMLVYDINTKFPEVYKDFPKTATPLTTWTSESQQYHSTKPVKSVDEVKGQKVIVWSPEMIEVAHRLGANPILINSTDTYLSLSKGMADGVICPIAPVRALKLAEIVKYHLMLNLGVEQFDLMVYTPLYDEFPADIKDYLKENTGKKMSLEIGKGLWVASQNDIHWLKNQGDIFYTLTPEDTKKLQEILAPFKEQWLKRMESRGYKNAPEVLKYAEERVAYYQAEFDKGVYTE